MIPVKGLQYELRHTKPYLMLYIIIIIIIIIIIPCVFGLGHKVEFRLSAIEYRFFPLKIARLYIPSRKFRYRICVVM
jgi:hypothetical protein